MSEDNHQMWNRACFMTRLVASSVKVAERAGSIIKEISNGDLKIVDKSGGKDSQIDYQTEADRSAQYCIVHSLYEQFGHDLTIIGEEEKTSLVNQLEKGFSEEVLKLNSKCPQEIMEIQPSDVVIWVDPLDGTTEFAQAVNEGSGLLEQVTVLIGITVKGRPIAGIVHQPFYREKGRTIWAIQGCGAHGLNLVETQSHRIIVTTRSHSTELVKEALHALTNSNLADEVKPIGGAGFKVIKVLEGAIAYVFASSGCKKWDTAAPEAILRAAGGELTDISGRYLYYGSDAQFSNSGGILATAPWAEHQKLLEAIPQHVKDALPEKVTYGKL